MELEFVKAALGDFNVQPAWTLTVRARGPWPVGGDGQGSRLTACARRSIGPGSRALQSPLSPALSPPFPPRSGAAPEGAVTRTVFKPVFQERRGAPARRRILAGALNFAP